MADQAQREIRELAVAGVTVIGALSYGLLLDPIPGVQGAKEFD